MTGLRLALPATRAIFYLMKLLPALFLLSSLLSASAQNTIDTNVPPAGTPTPSAPAAFAPLVRELVKAKTPAQWAEAIQKASPTAWQTIQKRAAEPNAKGFAMADFQALPEKEQKALVATLSPIITQAIGNLTPQEQVDLLTSAQKMDPSQFVSPLLNQALGLAR